MWWKCICKSCKTQKDLVYNTKKNKANDLQVIIPNRQTLSALQDKKSHRLHNRQIAREHTKGQSKYSLDDKPARPLHTIICHSMTSTLAMI
jgi:hypothetical protein